MMIDLAYGETGLQIEAENDWKVVASQWVSGLEDEDSAISRALQNPLGTPPLKEILGNADRLCVVVPDITRPAPTGKIMHALMKAIGGDIHVDVLIGTGSHRACTLSEIDEMLGEDVAESCNVINHDSYAEELHLSGRSSLGIPVWLNKTYVESARRVSIGLIEPHFFAGFSGGPKAIVPGVAGIETIKGLHTARLIDHPSVTWGKLEGNPVQDAIREACAMEPPDFSINVTINRDREVTGVFAGNVWQAHEAGCAFCRKHVIQPVQEYFDIVVTTNGGWPLDQNLYQTVKGLSAASQILKPEGSIVCASECIDGYPSDGSFGELLDKHKTPGSLLHSIRTAHTDRVDQWMAQVLCNILSKHTVFLHSSLGAAQVTNAFLQPVASVQEGIDRAREIQGEDATVAVLPEGPYIIPYVSK